jgi:hypothetical protein
VCDGDQLVESTAAVLRHGFDFQVDDTDEFKEDLKILDEAKEPVLFVEVKGTNAGIKREYVNQADNHRERAGLSREFPSALIMNTHIKNSRDLKEKDQAVPSDQVKHAAANNILILRTLDLLRLLRLKLDEKVSPDQVLQIMEKESGWLRCTDDGFEILKK